MRAGPLLARLRIRYGAELRIIFISIRAHARRAIVPLVEIQRAESMLPSIAACGRRTACRRKVGRLPARWFGQGPHCGTGCRVAENRNP